MKEPLGVGDADDEVAHADSAEGVGDGDDGRYRWVELHDALHPGLDVADEVSVDEE